LVHNLCYRPAVVGVNFETGGENFLEKLGLHGKPLAAELLYVSVALLKCSKHSSYNSQCL